MSDSELWPVWRVHADMHGFAAEPNKQIQHKAFIQTYEESLQLTLDVVVSGCVVICFYGWAANYTNFCETLNF